MDRGAWQATVCGVTKQRVGYNWVTITHLRVKHDLKRQTFSQLVGKSEYPSPKWLKIQQIGKMMINDNEDPWLECASTTAISSSPRRKPTQMLLPNKTVRCQVSRFTQSRDVYDSAQGKMREHLTFCC